VGESDLLKQVLPQKEGINIDKINVESRQGMVSALITMLSGLFLCHLEINFIQNIATQEFKTTTIKLYLIIKTT
jgi:hypothetical protein